MLVIKNFGKKHLLIKENESYESFSSELLSLSFYQIFSMSRSVEVYFRYKFKKITFGILTNDVLDGLI